MHKETAKLVKRKKKKTHTHTVKAEATSINCVLFDNDKKVSEIWISTKTMGQKQFSPRLDLKEIFKLLFEMTLLH